MILFVRGGYDIALVSSCLCELQSIVLASSRTWPHMARTNLGIGLDVVFARFVAVMFSLKDSFPCFDLDSQVPRLRVIMLPDSVVHDCFFLEAATLLGYIMPASEMLEHA